MKHVSKTKPGSSSILTTLDFHCTMAISASFVNFYERKSEVSSKTLYHTSTAYALVNQKLSGPESVSDSSIAAVISLAIYQQVHHQHATGMMHLNGLYRMIQLRGGIARLLRENRALAVKALRCVYLSVPNSSFILRRKAHSLQARCRDGVAEWLLAVLQPFSVRERHTGLLSQY